MSGAMVGYFFHFVDLLLSVVFVLEDVFVKFFEEIVFEVENFPAEGLEALVGLEEVGEFREIAFGHLVVAFHQHPENGVHCLLFLALINYIT